MLDFRGIESPPMNNLVLRVVFISISRAEYILVEASFRNIGERPREYFQMVTEVCRVASRLYSAPRLAPTRWRLTLHQGTEEQYQEERGF